MLVSGDAVRISTQYEEHVCQTRREGVFLTQPVSFRDHYNGEVLDWSLEITGTNNEDHTDREDWSAHAKTQVQETVDREGSSTRTCSTDPRETRSGRGVVTRDTTAGVSALEHYVSARACRMMLKGRTQQLVSYDVSAVSFRARIERDARVKLPKDFRLASVCDESILAPESRCKPEERHPETNPPMVD